MLLSPKDVGLFFKLHRSLMVFVNQRLKAAPDDLAGPEDLHQAIFDAFGRREEHLYEFQFGKGPMDQKGSRYVLANAFEIEGGEENPPAGRVDRTTIESLGLKVGNRFGYWFDFGDDWWHQIDVKAIEDTVPKGKLPKVTNRVGKSPPQYADEEE